MNRDHWMLIKVYAPALLLVLAALVLMGALSGLREYPQTAGFFNVWRCAPLGLLTWALGLAAMASYRLWRWEQGIGAVCPRCDGPLGRERPGIRGRGDYRKCMRCGDNINQRYY